MKQKVCPYPHHDASWYEVSDGYWNCDTCHPGPSAAAVVEQHRLHPPPKYHHAPLYIPTGRHAAARIASDDGYLQDEQEA